MSGADDPAWEAGTWEGSERARVRRALDLTVQERLAALERLVETSRRLAEAGAVERKVPPDGGRT